MRILFVVTWLYPRGGDSRHAFSVAEGLREMGHEVVFFGMEDAPNPPGLPGPLAPRIDYRELLGSASLLERMKALRSIYSVSAKEAACEFAGRNGPFDLVHIHSVHHQLTMSVVDSLSSLGIPVVWTLHDFKMVCPNTTLFRESTDERCPTPGRNAPFCVALHRCKKGSLAASLLTAAECLFTVLGGYYEKADTFIAPSAFLKAQVEKTGITTRPVVVLPNFSPFAPDPVPTPPGRDILYVGRLEGPKGIEVLLRAFARVRDAVPGRLVLVGDGPDAGSLRGLAAELLPEGACLFTGRLSSAEEIAELNRSASFIVQPSLWYENQPLSILEAFSCARPVIASRTGGIPELVEEGVTGLLVGPGSVENLEEAILHLAGDPEKVARMGLAARDRIGTRHSRNDYLARLMDIYRRSLGG